MLPSMTAAVLFARRGRGVRSRGWRSRSRRWPSRPARPRCSPSSTSSRASAGSAAWPRCSPASPSRPHWSRSPWVRAQLLYWAVLGNGSYVGVKTMTTVVLTLFLFMTGMWIAVQPAAALEDPERVAGPQARRARRRARHRPVALAAVGRGVGGGRPALLRPLLHAADPAARAAGRRRAVARQSRRAVQRTVAFALVVGFVFSAAGYFFHPFGPEPNYESVSALPRDHHATPTTRSSCGAACPEIYWASGRRPATRFLTLVVPHRQLPGPPAGRSQHRRRHRSRRGTTSTRTSPRTRPSTSSTRHRRRCAARRTTRSPTSHASSTSSTRSTATSSPSTASTSTCASSTCTRIGVSDRAGQRQSSGQSSSGSGRPSARSTWARCGDRVELDRRRAAARAALQRARRRARRRRGTRRRPPSAGTRLAGEVPDDGAQLPRRVEREAVVDADDRRRSTWSCRQWPPLRSVLLTSTSNTANCAERVVVVVEQREVVLVGIVVDEALHHARRRAGRRAAP